MSALPPSIFLGVQISGTGDHSYLHSGAFELKGHECSVTCEKNVCLGGGGAVVIMFLAPTILLFLKVFLCPVVEAIVVDFFGVSKIASSVSL